MSNNDESPKDDSSKKVFSSIVITQLSEKIETTADIDVQVIKADDFRLLNAREGKRVNDESASNILNESIDVESQTEFHLDNNAQQEDFQSGSQPQFAETHSLSFCYFVDDENDKNERPANDPCIEFQTYAGNSSKNRKSSRSKSRERQLDESIRHHASSQTLVTLRPSDEYDSKFVTQVMIQASERSIANISTQTSPEFVRRNTQSKPEVAARGVKPPIFASEIIASENNNTTHQITTKIETEHYSPMKLKQPVIKARNTSVSRLINEIYEQDDKNFNELLKEIEQSATTTTTMTTATTRPAANNINISTSSSTSTFYSACNTSAPFVPFKVQACLDDMQANNESSTISNSSDTSMKTVSNENCDIKYSNEVDYNFVEYVESELKGSSKPFVIACSQELVVFDEPTRVAKIENQTVTQEPVVKKFATNRAIPNQYVESNTNVLFDSAGKQSKISDFSKFACKTSTSNTTTETTTIETTKDNCGQTTAATVVFRSQSSERGAEHKSSSSDRSRSPRKRDSSLKSATYYPLKDMNKNNYLIDSDESTENLTQDNAKEAIVSISSREPSKPSSSSSAVHVNNLTSRKKMLFNDWENLINNLNQEQEKQRLIDQERNKHNRSHFLLKPVNNEQPKSELVNNLRDRFFSQQQEQEQEEDG